MTVTQIISYLISSPSNTNPTIVRQMCESLEGATPEGVSKIISYITRNPALINPNILRPLLNAMAEAQLDKSVLQKLVDDALTDEELSKYTDDSVAAYKEALTNAETALNEATTQEEIDAAADALSAAAEGLIEKEEVE